MVCRIEHNKYLLNEKRIVKHNYKNLTKFLLNSNRNRKIKRLNILKR